MLPLPHKTPTIRRKRGGQPGNTNALRHGFYSHSFTLEELQGLDNNVKGEFEDEIALARINALHLAEILNDYHTIPLEDFVAASNALNNYLDRIQSLSRARHAVFRAGTTLEQALEELRRIPPDED
jgi:hypothetical protein